MLDSKQVTADNNNQYNFALMIDVSDSVGSTLQKAKNAYIDFIKSLVASGVADVSTFAVIPFGSEASLEAPLNAQEAISVIEGLTGSGFTNFKAALEKAMEFYESSPSGINKSLFVSDGYHTMGGSFEDSAQALQEVADVQAYGFGFANYQELDIIDSDNAVVVSDASTLGSTFTEYVGGLVVSHPEDTNSEAGENKEIEIASAPLQKDLTEAGENQEIELASAPLQEDLTEAGENKEIELASAPLQEELTDTPSDTSKEEKENSQTPVTSPVIDSSSKLGSNIDTLTGGEFPIVNVEDISIEEGNVGSNIAKFAVNLSSPGTEEIKFSYKTIDGTAIAGSDYNPISGEITIPVGGNSANIEVEISGDREVESSENFTLNLFGLSSATFANEQAEYSQVAVIENDDAAVPQDASLNTETPDDAAVTTPSIIPQNASLNTETPDDAAVTTPSIIPQNASPNTETPDSENIINENLLDLKSFDTDSEVNMRFTVERQALFNNTGFLYKVNDTVEGTITDPVTGAELKPSDGEAYTNLAIQLREADLELSVDNQSSSTIEYNLLGGYFYAFALIVNGNIETLDSSEVYFSFSLANSDGVEHVRSLGNNTLGFEDLPNGGDNDFDDLMIRTEIV